MIYKIAHSPILDSDIETTATLHKDNSEWNFEKRPGMLYVVVRAVSVGTNGNGDHFTEEELRKSYKTFIGKGVFVNHASNDVEKKRGKIVDAKWCEDRGEIYIKTVLEVNAEAFPELARMIKSGMVDSVSMGCSVAYSNCSVCNNKAATTKQYCMHVRMHKGGAYDGRQVYEINHGIEFIEVSFVTTGADPQAKVLEVIARKRGMDLQELMQKAASTADPYFMDRLENDEVAINSAVVKSIKRANQMRGIK
jgi:hypothetical protein